MFSHCSANVGTEGMVGSRLSAKVATALTRPASSCPLTSEGFRMLLSTWPLAKSCTAFAPPL